MGKCDNCSSFWCSSKTEIQRHKSYFHRRPPKQQGAGKFEIMDEEPSTDGKCELQFLSAYKLAPHRRQTGHSKRQHSRHPDSVLDKPQKEGEKGENDGKLEEEVERCVARALTDENEVREIVAGSSDCDRTTRINVNRISITSNDY